MTNHFGGLLAWGEKKKEASEVCRVATLHDTMDI